MTKFSIKNELTNETYSGYVLTREEVLKQVDIWTHDKIQDYVNLDFAWKWLRVLDYWNQMEDREEWFIFEQIDDYVEEPTLMLYSNEHDKIIDLEWIQNE